MAATRLIPSLILPRWYYRSSYSYFSQSCCVFNKEDRRRSSLLHKLIKGPKKKSSFHVSDVNVKSGTRLEFLKKMPGIQGKETRRQTVLNALFMQYITDLMSTGEISKDLVGYGIEITKVKVAKDYSCVNVFWMATGTKEDVRIAEILKKCAGDLRSELIGLHILGVVPKIIFFKDKDFSRLAEVDRCLASADFGPDVDTEEPVLEINLYEEDSITSSLENQINEDIRMIQRRNYDPNNKKDSLPTQNTLSPMKMDVFGLDHAALMQQVKSGIQKSKSEHRQMKNLSENNVESVVIQINAQNQRNEQLLQFLQNRKKDKLYAEKRAKKALQQAQDNIPSLDEYEELHDEKIIENEELDYFDEEAISNERDTNDKL